MPILMLGMGEPREERPNLYTYQFQRLVAHDLHRENAAGAAPGGGSTSLPRHLQISPALSHTGEEEQEEGPLRWALEDLLLFTPYLPSPFTAF